MKGKVVLLLACVSVFVMLLAGCGPITASISLTTTATQPAPLPFEYISTPPENHFILFGIGDDDYTCLDGLCACPTVEVAAPPFGFSNSILQLDPYYLVEDVVYAASLSGTNRWSSLRKDEQAIGLIGVYSFSSTGDEYLDFIPTFPYYLDRYGIEIIGFDSQGAIQIRTKEGYSIVLPHKEYYTEMPELRTEECKVLNKLTLKNYGFMSDNNVAFSWDFDSMSHFPP